MSLLPATPARARSRPRAVFSALPPNWHDSAGFSVLWAGVIGRVINHQTFRPILFRLMIRVCVWTR